MELLMKKSRDSSRLSSSLSSMVVSEESKLVDPVLLQHRQNIQFTSRSQYTMGDSPSRTMDAMTDPNQRALHRNLQPWRAPSTATFFLLHKSSLLRCLWSIGKLQRPPKLLNRQSRW
ncbi:Uncharacterized protein Rs2_15629 [Raphanus sativus]|nr:Uncharacterized protein Rs2_15629 [Raphanus sativus]